MTNNQFLTPGRYLYNGAFEIKEVLGHGGFGVTYLAIDLSLNKFVAIKEFFPGAYCTRNKKTGQVSIVGTSSKEIINRYKEKFHKEATTIAKLKHPNIVNIKMVFEENNTTYFVMEYIGGGNLSDLVKRNGPLPYDIAFEYIRQIGATLDYLHARNMNHLDVKPANIMLREDGNAVLIDFGLSKHYDQKGEQTSTTPVGISHGYAPIEQYRCDGLSEFSPSTDIYSLAATLYYLISGHTPPNATELIESELNFPEIIPENIRGVLRKALSPSKKNRYDSAASFYYFLRNPASNNVTDSSKYLHSSEITKESFPDKNYFPMISYIGIGVIIVLGSIVWWTGIKKETENEKPNEEIVRLDTIQTTKMLAYSEAKEKSVNVENTDEAQKNSLLWEDKNRLLPSDIFVHSSTDGFWFDNQTLESKLKSKGFKKGKTKRDDQDGSNLVYEEHFIITYFRSHNGINSTIKEVYYRWEDDLEDYEIKINFDSEESKQRFIEETLKMNSAKQQGSKIQLGGGDELLINIDTSSPSKITISTL